MAKLYPYYGATSLMDYVDNYLFDGIYLLLGEDGTVVDNLGFPILQYVYGRFWVNNHAHIITGKEGFSVEDSPQIAPSGLRMEFCAVCLAKRQVDRARLEVAELL